MTTMNHRDSLLGRLLNPTTLPKQSCQLLALGQAALGGNVVLRVFLEALPLR
jgi:hypothetical protein